MLKEAYLQDGPAEIRTVQTYRVGLVASKSNMVVLLDEPSMLAAFGKNWRDRRVDVSGTVQTGLKITANPFGRVRIGAMYWNGGHFTIGMGKVRYGVPGKTTFEPMALTATVWKDSIRLDPVDDKIIRQATPVERTAKRVKSDVKRKKSVPPTVIEKEPPLETQDKVSTPAGLKAIAATIGALNQQVGACSFPVSLELRDGKLIGIVELQ